jgi:hypothetical protein
VHNRAAVKGKHVYKDLRIEIAEGVEARREEKTRGSQRVSAAVLAFS